MRGGRDQLSSGAGCGDYSPRRAKPAGSRANEVRNGCRA